MSDAGQAALERDESLLNTGLTGGDDYELAFAIPADKEQELHGVANRLNAAVARIGAFSKGEGVNVLDRAGETLTIALAGIAIYKGWSQNAHSCQGGTVI